MRSRGALCRVSASVTLILILGFAAGAQSRALDSIPGVSGLLGPSEPGDTSLQRVVPDRGANGLASIPLTGGKKLQGREAAEIPEEAYEDDEDWTDEDTENPSNLVHKIDASNQPAAAPAGRGLDTGTFAPAPGPASAPLSGVKRYVSSQAGDKEGDDLESEAQRTGNDTQSNRSLNDTRNEEVGVKDGGRKPSPSLERSVSNGTSEISAAETESSTKGGEGDENDDDEAGLIGSEEDPPRLSHRTSSWEGFGDPSKKLTLVVVCSNVGGGVLEVKVVIPTWIRADPESVKVAAGEERNITITVLDPKGLKSASERIQISSNGGDEYFEITSAALGRTDWTDGLPGSGGSTTTLVAGGSICVGLAVLGLWVWRRRQLRHGAAGFKYKELEMQGDRDLSSALGQLPAGAGMAMSYSSGYGNSRGPRTPTGDDSNRGWDDNWDDWDEEEQRSKR